MEFRPTKPKKAGIQELGPKTPKSPVKKEQSDWMEKFRPIETRPENDKWRSPVQRTNKEVEMAIWGLSNPKEIAEMGPWTSNQILEMLKEGTRKGDDNVVEKVAKEVSGWLAKLRGPQKPKGPFGGGVR